MKGNSYRKIFNIDKFARDFYCSHARLNKLRLDKKRAKKKARQDKERRGEQDA